MASAVLGSGPVGPHFSGSSLSLGLAPLLFGQLCGPLASIHLSIHSRNTY